MGATTILRHIFQITALRTTVLAPAQLLALIINESCLRADITIQRYYTTSTFLFSVCHTTWRAMILSVRDLLFDGWKIFHIFSQPPIPVIRNFLSANYGTMSAYLKALSFDKWIDFLKVILPIYLDPHLVFHLNILNYILKSNVKPLLTEKFFKQKLMRESPRITARTSAWTHPYHHQEGIFFVTWVPNFELNDFDLHSYHKLFLKRLQ